MDIQTDFLKDGLVGSPCCPGDSEESSPTPQFKDINSSALTFLYSPTHKKPDRVKLRILILEGKNEKSKF